MKFALVLLLSFFACEPGTQSAQNAVPVGSWGGEGIQVKVKTDGAAIDYGCDSGTIDEPLRTDKHGKFSARGTHTFGSGGPRNMGDPAPKPRQARYTGVRDGNTLQLTVYLPDLNRKIGEFTLRLGHSATLERCG